MMCKRLIINAGISKVVVRNTEDSYTVFDVAGWVENDDSLSGIFGY
jgi:dCMP deaminase